MGFYKEKTKDYFLLDTPVENMFINEYMTMAPGDYVKVYLFALMYAGLDSSLTSEDIAKHLNMEYEDVLKAWTYWEKMGVIRKHMKGSESRFDYDVEFVMLKEQLYGDASQAAAPTQKIGSMMADAEIKNMISQIEQNSGKVFNSSEIQEILSWIEEYQVLPETIAYAFAYCKKKRKTDIRYVGTLVRDWGSRGLKERSQIETYLEGAEKKRSRNRRIFKALGFSRNATEEEERIMDRWFTEMNLPMEAVLAACAKTSGINNPNINYVNKVLESQKESGQIGAGPGSEKPTAREILSYYDLLRRRDEAKAMTRRRQVYRKVPRIRAIEEEINALGSEMSKIIISDTVDKKKAMDQIREKMDALNTEKAFLLTENGYELNHMEIQYECPDCKDTGILETGEKCQCFGKVTREMIQEITSQAKK